MIVAVAHSQLGYHEGSNGDYSGSGNGSGNYTEYGYWHGNGNGEWCAYFISWCARMAGISTSIIRETGSAGKTLAGNGFADFSTYNPSAIQSGDIISLNGDHVGIVYTKGSSTLTVIEGNSSNQVRTVTYDLSSGYSSTAGRTITHYFSPNYYKNWRKIGGYWYYYDDNNNVVTGWITDNGNRYYLDPSTEGRMVTGWKQINGYWYYFNKIDSPIGKMLTGWQYLSEKWYYFNASGQMQTGWITYNGDRYYLEDSGEMVTGWKQIGGYWYYFYKVDSPIGKMMTGWLNSNGGWYYMDANGRMLTGKQYIDGKWYWFNQQDDPIGKMYTGWLWFDNAWHYFGSDGAMYVSRTATINGVSYTFDANGAMISSSSQAIGGGAELEAVGEPELVYGLPLAEVPRTNEGDPIGALDILPAL